MDPKSNRQTGEFVYLGSEIPTAIFIAHSVGPINWNYFFIRIQPFTRMSVLSCPAPPPRSAINRLKDRNQRIDE